MMIEVEDHAAEYAVLNRSLTFDPARTAVITIDMHRGHLDPVNATLPLPHRKAEQVLVHARAALRIARKAGMHVVHVVAGVRPIENMRRNPRRMTHGVLASKRKIVTPAMRKGTPHNILGSVQTEVMPELERATTDYLIGIKKSLSCFIGTDLESLLRTLQVDTLVLMGVNTNTCVQCAAFDSYNRGYRTIVLRDCVASMYGDDLHRLGVENIARCLGWVVSNAEFGRKAAAGRPARKRDMGPA
ncbi:MAG: cysteine hydrolase [Burkholderiales bacterium]|nr:cysteine hydrolase [Burkholderiales bacterium]